MISHKARAIIRYLKKNKIAHHLACDKCRIHEGEVPYGKQETCKHDFWPVTKGTVRLEDDSYYNFNN